MSDIDFAVSGQAKQKSPSFCFGKECCGLLKQFSLFLISFLWWESVVFRQHSGSFESLKLWAFIFLPSLAMLFASLTAWTEKHWLRSLVSDLLTLLGAAYYITQLVYFRIFGSFYSMSMAGMGGDALANFGWTMTDIILDAMGLILLLLLPLFLRLAVQIIFRKSIRFKPATHGLGIVIAAALWLLAVALLPISGNDETSAWYAYHGTMITTDSASEKIGALANSIVEGSRMVFGSNESNELSGQEELEVLTPVEPGASTAITLDPKPKEDSKPAAQNPAQHPKEDEVPVNNPGSSEDRSSSPAGTEAEPEGIPEEPEDMSTGYNIYEEIDFSALAELATDPTEKELCSYLASQTGTNRNEYTGMLKDYNLIMICAESYSNYLLNPDINPTLCKMASEGIVLNNYYNSFRNTTTNGEFSFVTGLWPDTSRQSKFGTAVGSFAQSADNYLPMGLGTLFNEQWGITSRAYHNYYGKYYSRCDSWANLGFTCKFMDEGMTFTTEWPASDLEMFEQSVNDYINDDHFMAYYMTFSGHGPYSAKNKLYDRNYETVKELSEKYGYTGTTLGYYVVNYELEKAMAYLMDRLEEAGKLENTLIVLTGDHYPYYLDFESLSSIAGHKVETSFELYKSSCIMWFRGKGDPIEVDTLCTNVDILPTVLNLLGMKYESRLMAGNDIFSDSTHVARIYTGDFVSDVCRYCLSNGSVKWLVNVSDYDYSQLQTYLESMKNYTKTKYSMSLKIQDTDFYRFVWVNSGLTNEEDIHVGKVVSYYEVPQTNTNTTGDQDDGPEDIVDEQGGETP